MASEAATAKDGQFVLVSMLPDVCFTPSKNGPPIPYPITHNMGQSKQCSPNVYFRGQPAYLHEESYVDNVRGDEPGAGKGVVSNTHTKISRSQKHSTSVFVNGKYLVRTGDMVWMNRDDPGNAGGGTGGGNSSGKAARWNCRKGQIAAAKDQLEDMPDGPEKERLQQATERFERNNVAVEHARLSQHVYDPDMPPPEGWVDISNDPEQLKQLGLESKNLQQEGSNFRAAVYAPDPAVFGEDMKPTVAFKGTENLEDWKNNLAQGVNMKSDYYERAVRIGTKLEESGAQVHITGHSLGGGLTSAASQASGMPGTTFNAAGLHQKTVGRYGGTVQQTDIQAYRVKGEALTGLQEPGMLASIGAAGVGAALGGSLGAAGAAMALRTIPSAIGTPYALDGKGLNPIDRHGMHQVIDSIEAEKSADQQSIASATGKTCP